MVKQRPKSNKRSRSFVIEVEVFQWCEKCGIRYEGQLSVCLREAHELTERTITKRKLVLQ